MANAPYEIPNELRDFAERSVDQARKAFEGFVTVAQKPAKRRPAPSMSVRRFWALPSRM